MSNAAPALRQGVPAAGFCLTLVLLTLACAPNSVAPGAETLPQAEQLSRTAEPAASTGIAPDAESDLEPGPGAISDENDVAANSQAGMLHVIVQAKSADAAAELVIGVGGRVTHRLNIIRAVGAELSQEQVALLEAHEDVFRIWEDRAVSIEPEQ